MDPTVRMLRAAVTLARTQHFRDAAVELGVSPSTLSDQIAGLEKLVGTPVFLRSSRAVTLTAFGGELVERAATVVREHDDLRAWLAERDGQPARTLTIGFLAGIDPRRTTELVRRTRESLPGWTVSVQQVGFLSGVRALTAGRIDVALTPGPVELTADVRGTVVWSEERVLMVERTHRLADRASVTLADLAGETVIAPTAGRHPAARWWSADPRPDGSTVVYGPPARDLEEVVQLVAAGFGVNLTAASAQQSVSHPDVRFTPILDAEPGQVWVLARAGDRSSGVTTFEARARALEREA